MSLKNKSRSLMIFIVTMISVLTFGQKTDTIKTFYPNGQIKDFRVYVNKKLKEGLHYLPNKQLVFKWNSENRFLQRYYPFEDIWVSHEDTLLNVFYQICPSYTLHDFYSNNQVGRSTCYIGKNRCGKYESYFKNGEVACKGQFNNDELVGVWTYVDGNGNKEYIYYISGNYENKRGKSISITYFVIPVLITLFVIISLGYLIVRRFSYNIFYISLAISTIIMFLVIFILSNRLKDDSNNMVMYFIYNYFVAISLTFLFITNLLVFINLFFGKKLKINFIFNLIAVIIFILLDSFLMLVSSMGGGGMIG